MGCSIFMSVFNARNKIDFFDYNFVGHLQKIEPKWSTIYNQTQTTVTYKRQKLIVDFSIEKCLQHSPPKRFCLPQLFCWYTQHWIWQSTKTVSLY